jgi:thioredoxin 1
VKQAAGDLKGEAVVAMINVDDNRNLAMEYGIQSIPAILVIKDREVLGSIRPRTADSLVSDFRELR